MDTLKLIKAEKNAKAAAKMPVPGAQNGGDHVAWESLAQDGGPQVLWTPVPQDGGPTFCGHRSLKMAEPACCGCSPLKHSGMAGSGERGAVPGTRGEHLEGEWPWFGLLIPAVLACSDIGAEAPPVQALEVSSQSPHKCRKPLQCLHRGESQPCSIRGRSRHAYRTHSPFLPRPVL